MSAIASASAANASASNQPSRFSELTSEEFIKIITTEMTRQDPLKPNDTNQLLQQLSGIRDIESSIKLSSSLEKLVGQSSFSAASGLIGGLVSGVSEAGTRVSGIVTSVTNDKRRGPLLTLTSGTQVRFANIDSVANPPAPAPTGGNGNGNGGSGTGSGSTSGLGRPVGAGTVQLIATAAQPQTTVSAATQPDRQPRGTAPTTTIDPSSSPEAQPQGI